MLTPGGRNWRLVCPNCVIFCLNNHHYNYLQITQLGNYFAKVIKNPSVVWLGLGFEKVSLKITKLNNILRHF